MDGLSAAASGMAVVSLTIQLIDSVREIRMFLRNISEAPKELKRLIDLLEQLELILENIGALVEKQQKHIPQFDIDVSGSVLRAMNSCESKLKLLEDVVGVAKKNLNASNKATRTIGSFKLACKKKDIEGFKNQLRDAISLLNLTMTTNLTVVHSESIGNLFSQIMATNQMTTTISKDLLLLRSNSTGDADDQIEQPSATLEARGESRRPLMGSSLFGIRSRAVSSYSGPFGRLIISKEVRTSAFEDEEQSSSNTYTRNESAWVFMPSFLSRCFDFRYLNSYGHIQRSIRTYPVLPYNHPVWEMCCEGDLKGIQKLLSDRQISAFSVDRSGNTLLHLSSWNIRAEVCKFLFEVGLTGQETNITGRYSYEFTRYWHGLAREKSMEFEKTYEVIRSYIGSQDPTLFRIGLFTNPYFQPPIYIFSRLVHDWLSKENVNDCMCPPLVIALRMFVKSRLPHRHCWKPIIQHLIRLGADLHLGSGDMTTLLDDFMDEVACPFESASLGEEWINILQNDDVSVTEYLRTEQKLRFDPAKSMLVMESTYETDYRPRHLIISMDTPSISWDWFIDTEGDAFDVLEEFKNFGPGRHSHFDDFYYPEEAENWPFFYPPWHWCDMEREFGSLSKVEHTILTQAEKRFERRWNKKAMKLARAQGLVHRGPKMPGGWID